MKNEIQFMHKIGVCNRDGKKCYWIPPKQPEVIYTDSLKSFIERTITFINNDSISVVRSGAFAYCTRLEYVSLPKCGKIGAQAFAFCGKLRSVYLLGSSIVDLDNRDAFFRIDSYNSYFYDYSFAGSVYVPASLISAYRSAQNWQAIQQCIVAYEGE